MDIAQQRWAAHDPTEHGFPVTTDAGQDFIAWVEQPGLEANEVVRLIAEAPALFDAAERLLSKNLSTTERDALACLRQAIATVRGS